MQKIEQLIWGADPRVVGTLSAKQELKRVFFHMSHLTKCRFPCVTLSMFQTIKQ